MLGGGAEGEVGLGADEVHHGLRLGEVHLAVEEGAAGEFAGLGERGAAGEEEIEDAAGDEDAAVALDLHHVLAGIARGGAMDGEEDLVEHAGRPSTMRPNCWRREGRSATGSAGAEDVGGDGDGAGAA